MTRNDSAADNNPSNAFQPMRKRFLVWDKGLKKFYTDSNGIVSGGGMGWLTDFLNNCGRPGELLEIIQSTNLFDEYGEEIFEGALLRDFDEQVGVVGYDVKEGGYWVQAPNGETWQLADTRDMKVMGHILSNPELWEEGWQDGTKATA